MTSENQKPVQLVATILAGMKLKSLPAARIERLNTATLDYAAHGSDGDLVCALELMHWTVCGTVENRIPDGVTPLASVLAPLNDAFTDRVTRTLTIRPFIGPLIELEETLEERVKTIGAMMSYISENFNDNHAINYKIIDLINLRPAPHSYAEIEQFYRIAAYFIRWGCFDFTKLGTKNKQSDDNLVRHVMNFMAIVCQQPSALEFSPTAL
jgi:hypothetical protein